MPVRSVVLVNESSVELTPDRLNEVARALQIQVVRDLDPVWDQSASVTVSSRSQVPAGAWPIRIVDDSPQLGVHNDENGHPFAVVRATSDWTITASHELLEMLVNPEGDRVIEGPDMDPDHRARRVQYLVEVCDACQVYDYPVGTVPVSDFVTPEYFRTEGSATGKVDFLGRLSSPLDVPRGGHLSWWDPQDRRWHQRQADGRFVRDAASTDAANLREDRDEAMSATTGELRHDLVAANRALFRDVAEAALQDLFAGDQTMRHIIARAAEKNGWDRAETEAAAREYRRYLLLRYLHPGIRIAGINKNGDQLWHEHIIDTDKYRHDCMRIFGSVLDHQPFYEPSAVPPEHDPDLQHASKLYTNEFGPPTSALSRTST
jgi:hypothetical protein